MPAKKFRIFFKLIVVLMACAVTASADETIHLKPAASAAHSNHPLLISIQNQKILDQITDLHWQTSLGKIERVGLETANFDPQGESGSAHIVVTARGTNGEILYGETSVQVYNQFVVLKADDLGKGADYALEAFGRLAEMISAQRIRAGFGLVGTSLDLGDVKAPSQREKDWHNNVFLPALKKWLGNGRIEFWNHGYTHYCDYQEDGLWEFYGSDSISQRDHIAKTQQLAREKLGITLNTFGAPCNKVDEETAQALAQLPEITTWIWNSEVKTEKFVISNETRINAERETGVVDLEFFKSNYNAGKEYFVIMLHPYSWQKEQWQAFSGMVSFLKEKEVGFVTPGEIAAIFPQQKDGTP